MNLEILKDKKTLLGFSLAFLMSISAIILAVAGNGLWVVFILLNLLLLAFSVRRADQLSKARGS
ncbi:hypothetical protein [Planococcus maitriensis]|uniref:Uncharacterized protein n=1 Tax=Planococcus maitriensis TaxID=221799 RepID=A0A365K9W6_9BACL|nr:hypothetical protein [Planococcus maitriensis]RAZ69570.1 hypothetical protein DP119_02620 [Planococcus maitriensis]